MPAPPPEMMMPAGKRAAAAERFQMLIDEREHRLGEAALDHSRRSSCADTSGPRGAELHALGFFERDAEAERDVVGDVAEPIGKTLTEIGMPSS
jgi:hypothetical protein